MLPQYRLDLGRFIPSVTMADDQYNVPGEISLLLAADIFFNVLIPENIRLNNGLSLQNTRFGFIIAGGISSVQPVATVTETTSNFISSMNSEQDLDQSLGPIMEKFFEVESVGNEGAKATTEEELCEKDFKKNVQLKLDIKSMFRQIEINPSQRHLQNILWKSIANAPIKCFQLQTVTYGLKSSSFLATRYLHELAERFEDNNEISWSKRQVLTYIGRIFDPLGLIGPIIIKAKLFMYALWQLKIGWDDILSEELHKKWCEFYESLYNMPPIFIDRNVLLTNATDVCIVGFCDASQTAYGCCIYARATLGKTVHVNLLCAKSRVAPQKNKLTIPKLELCSALLLSELISRVTNILKINKVCLFTDSMVALAWIQTQKINKLEPFVKNRVNKINLLTSTADWHHVPGLENPADCLSRGVEPQSLESNTLWWHGPDFYFSSQKNDSIAKTNNNNLEPESTVVGCHALETKLPILDNCSSISKMQRVIAYIYRFFNNCKKSITVKSQSKAVPSNVSPDTVTPTELKLH
ncbi:hypothetical protein evm_009564 [Chilo suppressalis]|nr:hypothetical protein evm_009564 [Chilo suppressalis]